MSWVSRVSRYPGRDLIAAAAASLVSLGLMALPVDGLLKGLLLVPLVLFIPGFALAAAMFPAATLSRGERLVYAFSLSVGAAALGGLAWQLAFGLGRFEWAVILTSVTLGSCAVAHRRRAALRPNQLPPSPRLTGPGALTAVGVLAAVVLAVFAVRTAIEGLQDQASRIQFHRPVDRAKRRWRRLGHRNRSLEPPECRPPVPAHRDRSRTNDPGMGGPARRAA